MSEGQDVQAMLSERGSRYGLFIGHAQVTQAIKDAMKQGRNWHIIPDDMKETLEMLAHKCGRILNGDPEYLDSWDDIIGYTQLICDRLRKVGQYAEKETQSDGESSLYVPGNVNGLNRSVNNLSTGGSASKSPPERNSNVGIHGRLSDTRVLSPALVQLDALDGNTRVDFFRLLSESDRRICDCCVAQLLEEFPASTLARIYLSNGLVWDSLEGIQNA